LLESILIFPTFQLSDGMLPENGTSPIEIALEPYWQPDDAKPRYVIENLARRLCDFYVHDQAPICRSASLLYVDIQYHIFNSKKHLKVRRGSENA
jgi:hypothetical protein